MKRRTINEKGEIEFVEIQSPNNPFEWNGIINEEASLTVPSMSYTVREIMEKHVRGINLPVQLKTEYEESNIDAPQISKLIDVTEVEQALDNITARIESKKRAQNRRPEGADLSATENETA